MHVFASRKIGVVSLGASRSVVSCCVSFSFSLSSCAYRQTLFWCVGTHYREWELWACGIKISRTVYLLLSASVCVCVCVCVCVFVKGRQSRLFLNCFSIHSRCSETTREDTTCGHASPRQRNDVRPIPSCVPPLRSPPIGASRPFLRKIAVRVVWMIMRSGAQDRWAENPCYPPLCSATVDTKSARRGKLWETLEISGKKTCQAKKRETSAAQSSDLSSAVGRAVLAVSSIFWPSGIFAHHQPQGDQRTLGWIQQQTRTFLMGAPHLGNP